MLQYSVNIVIVTLLSQCLLELHIVTRKLKVNLKSVLTRMINVLK